MRILFLVVWFVFLWLVTIFAAPVIFQDPIEQGKVPVTVTLSDGRIVPFGAGIICSEECPEIRLESEQESNKKWLIPVLAVAGATGAAFLVTNTPSETTITPVPEYVSPVAILLLPFVLRRKKIVDFGNQNK